MEAEEGLRALAMLLGVGSGGGLQNASTQTGEVAGRCPQHNREHHAHWGCSPQGPCPLDSGASPVYQGSSTSLILQASSLVKGFWPQGQVPQLCPFSTSTSHTRTHALRGLCRS